MLSTFSKPKVVVEQAHVVHLRFFRVGRTFGLSGQKNL
jgi:hypothetical protein